MKIFAAAVVCSALVTPQVAIADSQDNSYLIQGIGSVMAFPLSTNDKFQHVAIGSAISAFVTYKTDSFWKGCAASLAAGLVKEAYDEFSGTGAFEGVDVAYSVAGCVFTYRF